MRVLSLFTGIGGIDLGLERAGFTIAYHSEIDPYCEKVLRKHWPDVPNLGDVKNIKWEELDHVDVIAGGYPCQPFSTAGKRKGEEDSRHLWPYFRDAIRTIRPRYALMENVRGHLTLGFGTVLADLAFLGYSAEWQVLPASAFGAPHRRERLFIVAYADNPRERASERDLERERETDLTRRYDALNESGRRGQTVANTNDERCSTVFREVDRLSESYQSSRCVSAQWQIEPDVGRVAHGIPARMDRLRALGNAVVPQVAEWVGRRIMDHARSLS